MWLLATIEYMREYRLMWKYSWDDLMFTSLLCDWMENEERFLQVKQQVDVLQQFPTDSKLISDCNWNFVVELFTAVCSTTHDSLTCNHGSSKFHSWGVKIKKFLIDKFSLQFLHKNFEKISTCPIEFVNHFLSLGGDDLLKCRQLIKILEKLELRELSSKIN